MTEVPDRLTLQLGPDAALLVCSDLHLAGKPTPATGPGASTTAKAGSTATAIPIEARPTIRIKFKEYPPTFMPRAA